MINRVAIFLTVSLHCAALWGGELSKLPPNEWTVLHDGPPQVVSVHARLEWMPELQKGFIWPSLHYGTRQTTFEQYATVHYFTSAGEWQSQVTTYPKDLTTDYGNYVGTNYVWLPGLKRILLLYGGRNAKTGKSIKTWLLDPETGKWQAVAGDLQMCDRSADFNPTSTSDGDSLPLFGALVYDAHNKQAVAFGGAGTWGRVGKQPESLAVGDWFYDQTSEVKRVRRLLAAEAGKITKGRKWYPAHTGTWTFSEATRKWTPLAQPLGKQPSGRILPALAYDAGAKKILLFGGDNFTGPLDDTWIYDCQQRTWSQAQPEVAPPHRAGHAMVYLPDQDCTLLAGGFGPGWKTRNDTWVYQSTTGNWKKLAAELPQASNYCSAAYDPQTKTALCMPSLGRRSKEEKSVILGLRLNLATARQAPIPEPIARELQFHCKLDAQWDASFPEQWNDAKNKGLDPATGRQQLADLPANTWVLRKQPMPSRARQWGSYAYDPRNHKAYAWGGGHYGYTGCEVSEYDLLRNRWRSMNDVVAYKVNWRRGAAGGIPGPSFQGWRLMGTHARKSYAVDYQTNSLITLHGDVYDIAENRFVTCIGRCPGGYRVGDQVCFENTPHGVFGYHRKNGGHLYLADIRAGKWNLIAKGGPTVPHDEYATLCYDRKRDRLFYTVQPRNSERTYWSFDIATRKWTELQPANRCPGLLGCPTYVDDLDAILWTWGTGNPRQPSGKMTLYKINENRFYTTPWQGPTFGSHGNLNNSPHYDPELKVVVRLAHLDRNGFIPVGVLRLDPQTLKLTESANR